MNRTYIGLVALLGTSALLAQEPAKPEAAKADTPKADAEKNPLIKFETSLGDIVLELDGEKAPVSTANFVMYVEAKFFDGLIFHRIMPEFMIQGGGFTPDRKQKMEGQFPPIKNESNNGLKNLRGTISMARTSAPDSATSQFFINVVDNGKLDPPAPGTPGYAVFGRVVLGMDVVDKIKSVPTRVNPDQQKMYDDAVARGARVRKPEQSEPVDPPVIKTARKLSGEERAKLEPQIQAEQAREKEAAAKAKSSAEKSKGDLVQSFKDLMEKLEGPGGAKAVKRESGLIHCVLKEGTGASPKATDTVKVNYTGWQPDGYEFDSSAKNGGPIEFPLNGVIPGWTEGVQLMKVGGKSRFVIPGKLAYGEGDTSQRNPPKGTLIFDVELLAIK